jgi:hypothetical protein
MDLYAGAALFGQIREEKAHSVPVHNLAGECGAHGEQRLLSGRF